MDDNICERCKMKLYTKSKLCGLCFLEEILNKLKGHEDNLAEILKNYKDI